MNGLSANLDVAQQAKQKVDYTKDLIVAKAESARWRRWSPSSSASSSGVAADDAADHHARPIDL